MTNATVTKLLTLNPQKVCKETAMFRPTCLYQASSSKTYCSSKRCSFLYIVLNAKIKNWAQENADDLFANFLWILCDQRWNDSLFDDLMHSSPYLPTYGEVISAVPDTIVHTLTWSLVLIFIFERGEATLTFVTPECMYYIYA